VVFTLGCWWQRNQLFQKQTRKSLAILVAMQIRQYNEGMLCQMEMEHILGFTRSHWMPPLGKCLRHITSAASVVDEFVEKTQNTNNKLFFS
jgi:hypothetical protein